MADSTGKARGRTGAPTRSPSTSESGGQLQTSSSAGVRARGGGARAAAAPRSAEAPATRAESAPAAGSASPAPSPPDRSHADGYDLERPSHGLRATASRASSFEPGAGEPSPSAGLEAQAATAPRGVHVPAPGPERSAAPSPLWPITSEQEVPAAPAFGEGYAQVGALLRTAETTGYPHPVLVVPNHLLLDGGAYEHESSNCPKPLWGTLSAAALVERHPGLMAFTVNGPRIAQMLALGLRGLISDRPDQLRAVVADHARRMGTESWFDGLGNLRPSALLAYGHRGARGLRPENTLPAIEAALDEGCNGIEIDVLLTRDGVPVIGHDAVLRPQVTRRLDGAPLGDDVRVGDVDFAELQSGFVNDVLKPDEFPEQRNERDLSPVAAAFARAEGLPDPYVPPSVGQVLAFLRAYAEHYRTGPGRHHPDSERRAAAADALELCWEVKVRDAEERARIVPSAERVTDVLLDTLEAEDRRSPGVLSRSTIISFSARSIARAIERGSCRVAYDFER